MALVKKIPSRFYTGLDADKANITGVHGDCYSATDTGRIYKWDGTRWRGGFEYVPRSVDAADFAVGSFTTDGTWKVDSLDLSAIVSAGAVAVILDIEVNDDAANSAFLVRQSDAANLARFYTAVQVANQTVWARGIVPIDSNRLLDYFGSNLAFITINVTVVGWFI